MARARLAAYAALLIVLVLAGAAAPGTVPRPGPMSLAGAVAWPPSTGLLVAEVVTGGASASDEYVELVNAASAPLDLAGLEVAYATSSGATVTRKASWGGSLVLQPGQHLLLANSLGIYAPQADATYSGGLAATGGAVVLRPAGGAPVDSVGWGDAVNAFVEGSPAVAPAAGKSIERLPGGASGNSVDTNENALDLLVNATPVAQGLAAWAGPSPTPTPSATPEPTVAPTPTPTPAPTPMPSASPAPTPTPLPTPEPTASPSATPEPTPALTPTPEPTPAPTPTPVPSATPEPTPEPTASPSPTPEPTPDPTATPQPTPTPEPTLAPSPTPEPTPAPTATPQPTPTPTPMSTPEPTATPTASPTPDPTPLPASPISAVRGLADGVTVTIEGVLTTDLGALESGRAGFVQDATGGIAVYLDAVPATVPAAGTAVRIDGVTGTRYAERVVRAAMASVTATGTRPLPDPLAVPTGGAGEALEGIRLTLTGVVTAAPDTMADGIGLSLDDGSGPVRVIVGPAAMGDAALATGTTVTANGPLGQRDSTGTGIAGYRLHATLPGELVVQLPSPSPSPSASPSASPSPSASAEPTTPPSASPSASPSATSTPTPTPMPSPTPVPSPTSVPSPTPRPSATPKPTPTPTPTPAPVAVSVDVATARLIPVDGRAAVRGVVIAEAGRLGIPVLIVIADATGGIPVRLAQGQAAPARGSLVEASGVIAAPYGQTELRLRQPLLLLGTASVPSASVMATAGAGEATEGRLVRVAGTVTSPPAKATGGDIVLSITGADRATLRVYADASATVDPSVLRKGAAVTLTGIVGQRASHKGALDGYRLWLRGRSDVAVTAAPSASPGSSSPTPAPSAGGAPLLSVAAARARNGQTVTIEATVTTGRDLLDASGRRAIAEDATGAIELYLEQPDPAVRVGARVRATGTVGRAWGAPRLRVASLKVLGTRTPTVHDLRVAPGAATEWRLVRVHGTVGPVHKAGDRWTAELAQGSLHLVVTGLAGSGIPATALVEGRNATVTGIVKRPYPTATDRRFAIVPRSAADIALGSAAPGSSAGSSASGGAASSRAPGSSPDPGAEDPAPATSPGSEQGSEAPDVDLRDLGDLIGETVRVGGLVSAVEADGFRLDDGTAEVVVRLDGDAADLAGLVQPGDALNATGVPEGGDALVLVVTDPADIALLGDLGGGDASGAAYTVAGGTTTAALLGANLGPGTRGMTTIDAALAGSTSPGTAALAAATIGLAAAMGLALAGWIRYRSVLRTRRRIAERLARIAAVGEAPSQDLAAPLPPEPAAG